MATLPRRIRPLAFGLALAVAASCKAVAGDLPALKPGQDVIASPQHLALIVEANQLVVEGRDDAPVYTCYCGPQIALAEIPQHVRQALIAIEDRRFLIHNGVDPYGIGRGLVSTLLGRKQGGSTITQQLCKNKVLSSEESLLRKGLDAACAFSLETVMSKNEILEAYLNGMAFGYVKGRPIIGIEQAARAYFGKQARDLTVREGAVLVGMLRAPSTYNPLTRPKQAQARAETVLKTMVEVGFITDDQMKRYLSQPLGKGKLEPIAFEHRYFTDWVRRDLAQRGVELSRGARVLLTLEATTQARAERGFRRALKTKGLAGDAAARFVIIKLDGRVAAMMGGQSYAQDQSDGVAGDLRQPASSFKPVIYAAALEKGLKPTSRVLDGPKKGERWSAKMKAKAMGRITLSEALARSANIATVRLLEEAGPSNVAQLARRLGISASLRHDPSLALGTSEVSLLQLTSAFAPFANGGVRIVPHGYHGVIDARGSVVTWAEDGRRRALTPEIAAAMKKMLQRVVREGTGRGARVIAGAGGKTGTSDDNRDAWFVGFTHGQVTGVWAGARAGEPRGLPVEGRDMAWVWARIVLAFRGE